MIKSLDYQFFYYYFNEVVSLTAVSFTAVLLSCYDMPVFEKLTWRWHGDRGWDGSRVGFISWFSRH